MFVLSDDLRRILTAVSIALIGIFVVTVVAQALPLQLLQPAWIQKMCATVIGGVSFPMLGMLLLLLAAEGTPGERGRPTQLEEKRVITRLRRLSWVVAIGFVLMIPLQAWAGVKTLQQTIRNDQQQLAPYKRALSLIRIAETPDALMYALSVIPGVPPNISGQLKEPLPKVRQGLIEQIEPQLKARQNQLEALNGERWQQSILGWIKEGLNAALCALAFGAIGRLGPGRPVLVSGFLMPSASQLQWRRSLSSKKRAGKSWFKL